MPLHIHPQGSKDTVRPRRVVEKNAEEVAEEAVSGEGNVGGDPGDTTVEGEDVGGDPGDAAIEGEDVRGSEDANSTNELTVPKTKKQGRKPLKNQKHIVDFFELISLCYERCGGLFPWQRFHGNLIELRKSTHDSGLLLNPRPTLGSPSVKELSLRAFVNPPGDNELLSCSSIRSLGAEQGRQEEGVHEQAALFLERAWLQRPASSSSSHPWIGFGVVVSSVRIVVGPSLVISLCGSGSSVSGVKSGDLKIPPLSGIPWGLGKYFRVGAGGTGSTPGSRVSADVPPGHRRGVFAEDALPQ
ncbi:hypothetical protein NDU88_006169 [Pleurodeles waltl]|uniref:Uncharacterized protein n=1 Tax=Pleurodeles waltl TaxID=8319 RepID=A0AAV7UK95_PLEWA|nr:hypothetical protein NDU88_006169 [Pleurodeles waltl]